MTTDIVCQGLLHAKVVATLRGLQLEFLPGNPKRSDFRTRASFHVISGRQPVRHLTVGPNLAGLYKRSRAFAEACPEITCRPLFYHHIDKWDFLVSECFRGRTLESLVSSGELNAAEAIKYGQKALDAMERTLLVSSGGPAEFELNQLFDAACAFPRLTRLDQKFLRRVAFPFVRARALAGSLCTRWTNGDFVPRNLLVDEGGSIRLIDYEFAKRTHFYAEDFWRWRTFSTLPPEARELRRPDGPPAISDWEEVCFLLRQMVLLHEVEGANGAEAQYSIDRVIATAAKAHGGIWSKTLYQFLRLIFGRGATESAKDMDQSLGPVKGLKVADAHHPSVADLNPHF